MRIKVRPPAGGEVAVCHAVLGRRGAGTQRSLFVAVNELETRGRIEERHEQGRREDQALRIGDLGGAGEDMRVPERRLPGMERVGEELDLGLEMGLRVIRYRHVAEQPGRA